MIDDTSVWILTCRVTHYKYKLWLFLLAKSCRVSLMLENYYYYFCYYTIITIVIIIMNITQINFNNRANVEIIQVIADLLQESNRFSVITHVLFIFRSTPFSWAQISASHCTVCLTLCRNTFGRKCI